MIDTLSSELCSRHFVAELTADEIDAIEKAGANGPPTSVVDRVVSFEQQHGSKVILLVFGFLIWRFWISRPDFTEFGW